MHITIRQSRCRSRLVVEIHITLAISLLVLQTTTGIPEKFDYGAMISILQCINKP
ncbi:hypothetical protein J3458_004716 [Metarhizium acridum]|uniref:uncharacterized protein n=1 Tax=Metarhizium acridum TaxID=92637 RepID=UPI001C6B96C3|nr:hypothetical protein J3458_004716 [Metarhizium acridum]